MRVMTVPARQSEADAIDKRSHPRFSANIKGALMFEGNSGKSQSIRCTITDLSETGARITTAGNVYIPEKIVLFESLRGNIYHGEVRWRSAPTRAFASSISSRARCTRS